MEYAELHCHSYYSFHDGASSLEELMLRAKELGYSALALTDHDNLCGAMRFSHLARSMGIKGIIGAELTLKGGHHLTLLVENKEGSATCAVSLRPLITQENVPSLSCRPMSYQNIRLG